MKLGVLEAGPIAKALQPEYGRYGLMFRDLVGPFLTDCSFVSFAVHDDEFPNSPTDADGWIISGSKYGAYDGYPWIARLEDFLRDAYSAKVPIAGICFGHQILAQALGGQVIKSPKGWGLGAHEYDVTAEPTWMSGLGDTFSAHAIHQDQVVSLPQGTHILARSEFCEYAALVYGDPEKPNALTVQPHPEMDEKFVRELIELRRGSAFPEQPSDEALGGLGTPVNNADWGRWIATFFARSIRPDALGVL